MSGGAIRRAGVVGPDGFIGSAFSRELSRAGYSVVPIRRDTALAQVEPLELAFFCAGNSAAFLTRREPLRCLDANVGDLYRCLTALRARRWVLLSSTAVYPLDLADKREDAAIDVSKLPLYGAHKALSELYLREYAPEAVVLRAGYLFGQGLKKNLLYDLRQGRRELFLTPASILSPLDVDQLAEAGRTLAERAAPGTYNVSSAYTLSVAELTALRGGEYSFAAERHLDERGLSLARLHQHWQQPQTEAEYRQEVANYLKGT